MLFAGWEAVGRGQHSQDRGHSFSPYGPPSRQLGLTEQRMHVSQGKFQTCAE